MKDAQVKLSHYVLQGLYVGLFLWFVLVAMDMVTRQPGLLWAVGASSLASSAYITFCFNSDNKKAAIHMIGAYLLSVLIGIAGSHLSMLLSYYTPMGHMRAIEVATACAVTFSFLLQTILNFQHPPAAGMSLVLTLEPWSFDTVMVILLSVFVLALIPQLMGKHLRDLRRDL